MEIRVLGAHNSESANTGLVSFLIDDVLALDAGSLTSGLSLSEQNRVSSILLTHYHYDHIRDVAAIALNASYHLKTIKVYSLVVTLDALESYIVNGVIYPKFTEGPTPEKPSLKFFPVEPNRVQSIDGYQVVAVPANHTIPTVGYQITSRDGKSLLYSGDTTKGCAAYWRELSPQILFTEVTLPNRFEKYAAESGHLSPNLLKQELTEFGKMKGGLPPVILVHMSPQLESEIKKEIDEIAMELETPITLGYKGMRVSL